MNDAPPFVLFGPAHLVTILFVVLTSIFLPLVMRRHARAAILLARGMAAFLAAGEIFKLLYRTLALGQPLAYILPLHLCGVAVWLAVVVLWWRSFAVYEVLYFWGLAGTLQAILTPDLAVGFPHPHYLMFFLSHGLIIVAVLYATLVFDFRPTWRSLVKALVALNLLALVVAPVNLALDTNYLFLRAKPAGASLMDYLGPWPWYIAVLEGLGVVVFVLCYLPFAILDRRSKSDS